MPLQMDLQLKMPNNIKKCNILVDKLLPYGFKKIVLIREEFIIFLWLLKKRLISSLSNK